MAIWWLLFLTSFLLLILLVLQLNKRKNETNIQDDDFILPLFPDFDDEIELESSSDEEYFDEMEPFETEERIRPTIYDQRPSEMPINILTDYIFWEFTYMELPAYAADHFEDNCLFPKYSRNRCNSMPAESQHNEDELNRSTYEIRHPLTYYNNRQLKRYRSTGFYHESLFCKLSFFIIMIICVLLLSSSVHSHPTVSPNCTQTFNNHYYANPLLEMIIWWFIIMMSFLLPMLAFILHLNKRRRVEHNIPDEEQM
jgi:hypothetical protein